MMIVHLTASRFFGGPERQMLGLAAALRPEIDSAFIAFCENGLYRPFLDKVGENGFRAAVLPHDTPWLAAAFRDLLAILRDWNPDVLLCHNNKPNLFGLLAARRLGIPVISISRGWTGESARVRLYDALDRRVLRGMDKVVCVSEAQSQKVRQAGVRPAQIHVIRNAIRPERFDKPDPGYREQLRRMFPSSPQEIVGAAGRLSPEKGFSVLVDAAAEVIRSRPETGFVLFGDGPLGDRLANQVRARGLEGKFILAGFHEDLDRHLPHLDLFVLPSYSEGLPNVALEALAAGVPVVATAVGGTPEVIVDGQTGYLVSPGDAGVMARRILAALSDGADREQLVARGVDRVRRCFSFTAQAQAYDGLFGQLASRRRSELLAANHRAAVGS